MRYSPSFSLAVLGLVAGCGASADSKSPQASEPAGFTPVVSPLAVAACDTTPTPVASSVGLFNGGGGTLAFTRGTDVFVLPSSARAPVQVAANVNAQDISVGATHVLFTTPDTNDQGSSDQWVVSVNTSTGARVTLTAAHWIVSPLVVGDTALYWTTDTGEQWTLWSSPLDGSRSPVAMTTLEYASELVAHGSSVVWADPSGSIWTAPADGSVAPALTHVDVNPNETFALHGSTVYFWGSGALYTEPFTSGGAPALFASSLPDDFPATEGELGMGLTSLAVGPRRTFWSQAWSDGEAGPNGATLTNWVLRAGADVDHITTVDSFTWSPTATTFGSAPQVASDGVAVYWTREGTLMRMCD